MVLLSIIIYDGTVITLDVMNACNNRHTTVKYVCECQESYVR